MSSLCDQIVALDIRYNVYRAPNNPQSRTLYVRRRKQLLKEKERNFQLDSTARREYLRIRSELLASRYGTPPQSAASESGSIATAASQRSSLQYQLPPFATSKVQPRKRTTLSVSSTITSTSGAEKNSQAQALTIAGVCHIFDQHAASVPRIRFANQDRTLLAFASHDCTISVCRVETTPARSEVLCILKGHAGPVNDVCWSELNDCLLSCSSDGTCRVWRVTPPRRAREELLRHSAAESVASKECKSDLEKTPTHDQVHGYGHFTYAASSQNSTEMSEAYHYFQLIRVFNDTSASSSLVGGVRSSLDAVRSDQASGRGAPGTGRAEPSVNVHCCVYEPANNNLVVTGNSRSLVQVYNVSTGLVVRGGVNKVEGNRVLSLEFDASGQVVWAADDCGNVTSFLIDASTGRLTRAKRVSVLPHADRRTHSLRVTSLHFRLFPHRTWNEPVLLLNCANSVCLYRVSSNDGVLSFKKRFFVKQVTQPVRSCFSPLITSRHATFVVSGSEDGCVYVYDSDAPDGCAHPLNKLQGHAAPALDVAINYDETLMATSDANGVVIIWRIENN